MTNDLLAENGLFSQLILRDMQLASVEAILWFANRISQKNPVYISGKGLFY